jgi:predicted N-formylglutamate amidohydrolase
MTGFRSLLLTCEHGGNQVPSFLGPSFQGAEEILQGHRGFDRGALELATHLQGFLDVPLLSNTMTRLVVDLNRSETNRDVFSEFTRSLGKPKREELLARFHRPHWQRVREVLEAQFAKGSVLHVGVHSFVPEVDGRVRQAELALLYDPARRGERELCSTWHALLRQAFPTFRVRRNYPFRGVSDGLPTALRKLYPSELYAGVELEVNNGLVADLHLWPTVLEKMAATLKALWFGCR